MTHVWGRWGQILLFQVTALYGMSLSVMTHFQERHHGEGL